MIRAAAKLAALLSAPSRAARLPRREAIALLDRLGALETALRASMDGEPDRERPEKALRAARRAGAPAFDPDPGPCPRCAGRRLRWEFGLACTSCKRRFPHDGARLVAACDEGHATRFAGVRDAP